MSLIEELRIEYKKAHEDRQNRIDKEAENLYNSVIEIIKKTVKEGESTYVCTSLMTTIGGNEVQNKIVNKLKKDGFTVMYDEIYGFEISGWADEPSPWTEFLEEA